MEIIKINICLMLCSVTIFQICVNAAPSDLLSKLENISKVEENVKEDNKPNSLEEDVKNDNNVTEQGQRQKRFYNYHGYGFPPINPVIYPNFNRNDFLGAGFGLEDPFMQIHRRLQDISNVVRQPGIPPPLPIPNNFPIFFPVIYIPQISCVCNPNVRPVQNKPTPRPIAPTITDKNGTDPNVDISNRFPEMEDTNQNWGIVVDEPFDEDDGQEEDYTRPITLIPVTPNRTMSRPPPPVNHGTNQSGGNFVTEDPIQVNKDQQEFARPISFQPVQPPNRPFSRPPPPVDNGSSQAGGNQGQTTTTSPGPTFRPATAPAPTPCDGAVLSCCHQPEVTFDCFAIQGCPDPTAYGNPCEPQVILRVIDRFQRFYGQRAG